MLVFPSFTEDASLLQAAVFLQVRGAVHTRSFPVYGTSQTQLRALLYIALPGSHMPLSKCVCTDCKQLWPFHGVGWEGSIRVNPIPCWTGGWDLRTWSQRATVFLICFSSGLVPDSFTLSNVYIPPIREESHWSSFCQHYLFSASLTIFDRVFKATAPGVMNLSSPAPFFFKVSFFQPSWF